MKLEYLTRDHNTVVNPETYRGFSSYHYQQNRTRDHCMIGQEDFYISIRIIMLITVLITTLLICIVLPIPIMDQCKQAHEMSQPNSKSDEYYKMQALVIISPVLWACFICYFVYGINKYFPEANAEMDVKVHYFLFGLFVFAVYPIGIFCYNICLSEKKKLRDRLIVNGCGIFSVIYYWFGLTLITCIVQFVVFHSFYIIIAMTVVSGYQILAFIFLTAGIAITVLLDITYALKACDSLLSKTLKAASSPVLLGSSSCYLC